MNLKYTEQELVSRIVSNLENENDSPHYVIGYLSSMLSVIAAKSPVALDYISETLDYTNLPNDWGMVRRVVWR